jgi:hypothetical protein
MNYDLLCCIWVEFVINAEKTTRDYRCIVVEVKANEAVLVRVSPLHYYM